jgi:hypothetical protein
MIFSRFVVRFLPAPNPNSRFHYLSGYADFYHGCKHRVIKWHREQLEKLDFRFRLAQAQQRLVAARELAQARGIGPLDSRYPDLFDFHPLPEILGPNG